MHYAFKLVHLFLGLLRLKDCAYKKIGLVFISEWGFISTNLLGGKIIMIIFLPCNQHVLRILCLVLGKLMKAIGDTKLLSILYNELYSKKQISSGPNSQRNDT